MLERYKHLSGGTTTTCVFVEKDVIEFMSTSLFLQSLDCMAIIMLRGHQIKTVKMYSVWDYKH